MITVKLSHSILDAWASGKYEAAVAYYLGKDYPSTPQMELGRLKDEEWTNHIMKTGFLPEELGGDSLNEPIAQQKYEKIIPLSDDAQILLRGRLDLLDGDEITDFKCGMTEPAAYVDKMQMPYYKLLVPEAKLGKYLCFNPYFDVLRVGVVFLTDKDAERALEHIITFGSEMIDYLKSQKLLVNYKPEVYV